MNWSWPYTGTGPERHRSSRGLVSYAANVRVFGTLGPAAVKSGTWSGGNAAAGWPRIGVDHRRHVEHPVRHREARWSRATPAIVLPGLERPQRRTDRTDGINTWAVTDMRRRRACVLRVQLQRPGVTWDDETASGGWPTAGSANEPFEYFQPPVGRLVPTQQSFFNIYPIHAGGVQALMGDGSVRMIRTRHLDPGLECGRDPERRRGRQPELRGPRQSFSAGEEGFARPIFLTAVTNGAIMLWVSKRLTFAGLIAGCALLAASCGEWGVRMRRPGPPWRGQSSTAKRTCRSPW